MPRGSFRDIQKGGVGFIEGYVLIQRSVSKVFQYPVNATTGVQSEAFTAMVWEGIKLSPEWKPLTDAEGNQEPFEIINRMAALDQIRPGKLNPKDFDDLDKMPEDLGADIGTEGNAFHFEPGAKFAVGWGHMLDSLEKQGFKPEILGRCIAADFEGMTAHFKTVEGEKYIARKGKDVGKEVAPKNLICDRIQPPYPYDIKDKTKIGKPPVKGAGAGASSAAAGGKTNGEATDATGVDTAETGPEVAALFADFSDKFRAEVPTGKAVKRAAFQKALTMELLRKKVKPDVQKAIMDFVKGDELAALGEATELFTVSGDSITIA